MEMLKNVLIKEVDGSKLGDKVFFVDNLPKNLLYQSELRMMIDYTNPQQNLVPAFTLNERSMKVPTGERIDVLKPGIERSQTGDGAYVFFTQNNEGYQRLQEIDRYIAQSVPVAERVAHRVPYALQPGVMSSGPKPLSDLPRVVLPEPVSPPANAVQTEATPSSTITERPVVPEKKKRVISEATREKYRKQMAHARAVRDAKKQGTIQE